MAIEIGEYRQIRTKILFSDSAIRSADTLIFKTEKLAEAIIQKDSIFKQTIQRHTATIARKDKTIEELNENFRQAIGIAREANEPLKLFNKPWLDYTTKIVFGGALLYGALK